MHGRFLVKLPLALVAIGALTFAAHAARLNQPTVGFLFLTAVLFLSIWGGLVVGMASSLLATACYNFFFLPPLYTFTIADPENWVGLAAFLATSIVVSRLVVSARVEAERAEQRRREVEALYGLSLDLFTATNRVGALGEAAGRALAMLGAQGGGLVLFDGNVHSQRVVWWSGPQDEEQLVHLIAGVGRHKETLELPSRAGRDLLLPLVVGGKVSGVLVAQGPRTSREALESVSRLVALAVERERFLEENAHLQALRESDALKTSLLRAVSHDLTTPLTAISLHIEALQREAAGSGKLHAAADAIADETGRLRRRIGNLLVMARLEAGRFTPSPEPTPPADLFRAVRENLPLVFARRPVSVRVDPDCPDAQVDPSLALEIIVNLVENAHRAAPAETPIELVARRHPIDPGKVRLEVLDRGPGISPPAAEPRSGGDTPAVTPSDVAQRGLGLEIARSLAKASQGSLGLSNRPEGGAVARLDLPAATLVAAEQPA